MIHVGRLILVLTCLYSFCHETQSRRLPECFQVADKAAGTRAVGNSCVYDVERTEDVQKLVLVGESGLSGLPTVQLRPSTADTARKGEWCQKQGWHTTSHPTCILASLCIFVCHC